ncbi:DUF58 domain-containing protein [Natronorubrum thiooxidans]|uniref:Uncharacterized conserved protein, DUF58 family, contains vWF domain n=1 Tax=Natronorubrum thiooxidans TaxID=308853 RepID=A0A1N7FEH6_9EURY|nr:DUF58 domain-containing protein [Natronorubrum thiooxidans]SIR98713.1 Uncharacterized conserved protein, DUF58 family, contains vWF domain [Natronorubrum thiooxidans]
MRLTIRGWTVVAVLAASVAMAWQYGPRALNAVVTPLLVVLVAGLITTYRVDRPEITRAPVPDGSVGDHRTVEIALESDTTVSATVRETVGDGLSVSNGLDTATADGDDTDHDLVLETILEGDDQFSYELQLTERGEARVGPLSITVSDVFGLVERRFTDDQETSVLVYPRVHELQGAAGTDLRAFVETIDGRDRTEFDHLREYQHGDDLRDVNWNVAAKRPDADLVVTEYATAEEHGSVTVAADCPSGWADDLATAVASVTTHLLETDVSVGVSVPGSDYAPGTGRQHRRDLLAAFAVLEAGELEAEQRQAADILVRADAEGTRIVVDGRTVPFDRLTGDVASGRLAESTRGRPDGDEPGVAT